MNSAPNLNKLSRIRVLAIGDIMLDRYNYGRVDRISPEAPVPVFRPGKEKTVLGGVGNVVANLVSFGCNVDIISRTGLDKDGKTVAHMTSAVGANLHFLHQADVPTTVKTRLIAGNNHLLRIDAEKVCPLDDKLSIIAARTLATIRDILPIHLITRTPQ